MFLFTNKATVISIGYIITIVGSRVVHENTGSSSLTHSLSKAIVAKDIINTSFKLMPIIN